MGVIEININPNLVQKGSLTISWHSFLAVVAIVMAVYLAARLAKRDGIHEDVIYAVATWAIPGGIIGARLFYIIPRWDFYSSNPSEIIRIWNGGISIYGAIIGGTVVGVGYALWKKLPVTRIMDLAAPGVILAMAVGRVGDIINGEHLSKTTSLPWAWVHLDPRWPGLSQGLLAQPGPGVGYHPAVVYELLWDFIVVAVLWRLLWSERWRGLLLPLLFALYGAGRFALQFIRDDPKLIGPLQDGHVFSLIVLGVSVPYLAYMLYRQRLARPEPTKA